MVALVHVASKGLGTTSQDIPHHPGLLSGQRRQLVSELLEDVLNLQSPTSRPVECGRRAADHQLLGKGSNASSPSSESSGLPAWFT